MRNGNSGVPRFFYSIILSSYRTYEEWKLVTDGYGFEFPFSSYRTYEEWKHERVLKRLCFLCVLTVPMRNGNWVRVTTVRGQGLSSYRTYEEWKLKEMTRDEELIDSSYRTYEEWKLSASPICSFILAWFLPYLWGMETLSSPFRSSANWPFLPYLWGMETGSAKCNYFDENANGKVWYP